MSKLSVRKWLLALLLPAALFAPAACGESDRDETAPSLTLTLPAADQPPLSPRQSATVDLSGTIEAGATLEARLNDVLVTGLTVTGETWAGTIAGLLDNSSNLIELTATDAAGNTNTITISIVRDNTPPTVQSTSPVADTVVPVPGTLTILFSEAMNKASVENNVTVAVSPGGPSVTGTVEYTASAVFTPAAPLSAGTTYTVTLGAGITDLAGNLLTAQSFSFTTAP